jgi:hypothetical protein
MPEPIPGVQPLDAAVVRLDVVCGEARAILWKLRSDDAILTALSHATITAEVADHVGQLEDVLELLRDARFGPAGQEGSTPTLPF